MGPRFRICRGSCHQYRLSYPDLLGSRFWRAPSSPENSQTQNNIVTKGPRVEEPVWSLVPWPNYVLFSLQAPTQSQAWNARGVRRLHEKGRSQSHSTPQAPRATVRNGALPGIRFRPPPPPKAGESWDSPRESWHLEYHPSSECTSEWPSQAPAHSIGSHFLSVKDRCLLVPQSTKPGNVTYSFQLQCC